MQIPGQAKRSIPPLFRTRIYTLLRVQLAAFRRDLTQAPIVNPRPDPPNKGTESCVKSSDCLLAGGGEVALTVTMTTTTTIGVATTTAVVVVCCSLASRRTRTNKGARDRGRGWRTCIARS